VEELKAATGALALLNVTDDEFTVIVKLCVAFGAMPFVAVKVSGYVPPDPAAGVPVRTPVAGVNVTPAGSVPVTLNVGAGVPVAVTLNVDAVPTAKIVLVGLVMTGAVSTVSVKLCVAFGVTPFCAVNVIG
jgi:hypothetical protein